MRLSYIRIAIKQNGGDIDGIQIIPPEKIREQDYDKIVIASITATYSIRQQLIDYGVNSFDIDTSYMDLQIKARERFLSDFASIVYKRNLQGNVAEAGVFQGEFAKIINQNFPGKKLYLFDTFEGFDDRDIVYEEKYKFSSEQSGHLHMTSEDMVMQKMACPLNCIIKRVIFRKLQRGLMIDFVL